MSGRNMDLRKMKSKNRRVFGSIEKPCDECQTRKMYARTFDMHISGEDCPYECEEYEHWKQFQKELNHEDITSR